MKKRILLSSPHMSDEKFELSFVNEAFETNWIAPMGENVNKFELEIADYIGDVHAVALSSGTAALHLALKLAGVGEGDIVLCQSLTFSATANPIIYQGAKPVFIDSDYKTWNMDPVALRKALEKYPNTKALMVVHLYGMLADMDEINAICKEYDVIVIEDAAESMGSTYKGKQSGALGDLGVISFNGNKIITTSGGGALLTKTPEQAQKARFWSTQSRENELHYQHNELGYNYRMSNVVAGIGRGQMMVLDQRVEKKRSIFNKYQTAFKEYSQIEMMPMNEWNKPNCWLSAMTLDSTIDPKRLIRFLDENNVESRPLWKPMHLQPFFSKFDYFGTGVSEDLFNRGICLPSDSKMSDEEQEYVIGLVKSFIEEETTK